MNGQIVLCKGINDRGELEYSLEKLAEYDREGVKKFLAEQEGGHA